ncbi:ribose 5-phosphate isomerase B [bacterium]|nr:ribose 5-phosphate isomerase B [bacterium]
MRVAIGADHAGFEVKERLKARLKKAGHEVQDVGTASPEPCDYPEPAFRVARSVASGESERGVLVCGSGVGMAIAANKVAGVRAAPITDPWLAEMCRRHNDVNVLCAAARLNAPESIERFVDIFLSTAFEAGRHQGRVDKIKLIEQGKLEQAVSKK